MSGDNNLKITLGSMAAGIVGAEVTLPIIRLIIPPDTAHLTSKAMIAAIFVAFFAVCTVLDMRAVKTDDDPRRIFLTRSLQIYFVALAAGEIAGILWISESFNFVRTWTFVEVSVLASIAFVLLAVQWERRRRSS